MSEATIIRGGGYEARPVGPRKFGRLYFNIKPHIPNFYVAHSDKDEVGAYLSISDDMVLFYADDLDDLGTLAALLRAIDAHYKKEAHP